MKSSRRWEQVACAKPTARDTRLNRDVAIKCLPDAFAADPDRLMRFEREARTPVRIAAERLGISRSTYKRWRRQVQQSF